MQSDERILDRLDAIDRRSGRNDWRLDALDSWRKEIDARVAVMESKVNDLRFSDAVAEALAEKLDAQRHITLSIMQKIGAGVFALLLVTIPIVVEKLT